MSPTHLPNLLTLARIAVIPPIVGLFLAGAPWADWTILGLFAAAGVTDYLDGALARSMAGVSRLGQFLDPIADKLLVTAALLMLAGTARLNAVGLTAALVIVLREIMVSGLREFLAGRADIAVTRLAKWKTAAQFCAIPLLVLANQPGWGPTAATVGTGALVIAAILTLITGWHYLRTCLPWIMHDGPADPR